MPDGFADGYGASQLYSVLDNPVVLECGLGHLAPFVDIVCGGLLHIHILPGLTSQNGLEGMPVVRGSQGDGINIPVVIQTPEVLLHGHLVAIFLLKLGSTGHQHLPVRVAKGNDFHLHRRELHDLLNMRFASPVHPQDRNPDSVIGTPDSGGKNCRGLTPLKHRRHRCQNGPGCGGSQKGSPGVQICMVYRIHH